MFRTILGADQVYSGKNTEINKQLHVKFWFNHIYLAVIYIFLLNWATYLNNFR